MTQVKIDERLIERARRLGKHRTRDSALRAALREYVEKRARPGILDLIGQVEYRPDYNHKHLRNKNPK